MRREQYVNEALPLGHRDCRLPSLNSINAQQCPITRMRYGMVTMASNGVLSQGLRDSEQSHLWREYSALEARMQNDSRVAYTVLGALLTATVTLLSASIVYFGAISASPEAADFTKFSFALFTGLSAVFTVMAASAVEGRFRDTGIIRQARAAQIEQLLGIHSFRLFRPWVKTLSDVPTGYFSVLGQIAWDDESDRPPPCGYDLIGQWKHFNVMAGVPFSRQLRRLRTAVLILVGLSLVVSLVRVLMVWS